MELVRDNLATFANLRGGRLRSSSFVWKSRSARVQDERKVPLFVVFLVNLVCLLTLHD